MNKTIWLNGVFYDDFASARLSINDRSTLMADAVYEVMRIYDTAPFRLHDHIDRLFRSAAGIELTLPFDKIKLASLIDSVIERSGLSESELYIQVSRGVAPRSHSFPKDARPTAFMWIIPPRSYDEQQQEGAAFLTLPGERWLRCDLKTVNILANSLAKEIAHRAGAFGAILIRDGIVTEAAEDNVFVVKGGTLCTHPLSGWILAGITRQVVIELAGRLGLPVVEEQFGIDRLYEADEVFSTGTTPEIIPVVSIDGRRVGDGSVGPIVRRLQAAYHAETRPRPAEWLGADSNTLGRGTQPKPQLRPQV